MDEWMDLELLGEDATPARVRRFTRRAVDIGCELVLETHDEARTCSMRDLTPFGAFIETEELLPVGEPLVVSFYPPGRQTEINLFAAVARVADDDRPGMALSFSGLTAEEHALLSRSLIGVPPPLRTPSMPRA
ncbi:MAG: PilZ domain-containing protein [Myxococcales bacterium]|nr:PilZ domain-containing protein [Myxococcales bacterium]